MHNSNNFNMHKFFLEEDEEEDEDEFKILMNSLQLSPMLWAAIQKVYYKELYGAN